MPISKRFGSTRSEPGQRLRPTPKHRQIVTAFEALAAGTREGRSVDNVRQGYFRLTVGSHFIFYREAGEEIEIVRVLHQRQDIERHL